MLVMWIKDKVFFKKKPLKSKEIREQAKTFYNLYKNKYGDNSKNLFNANKKWYYRFRDRYFTW